MFRSYLNWELQYTIGFCFTFEKDIFLIYYNDIIVFREYYSAIFRHYYILTNILLKRAAKPVFGGLLLATAALWPSTSLREPESNSCERLSLLKVPECFRSFQKLLESHGRQSIHGAEPKVGLVGRTNQETAYCFITQY